MHYKDSGNVDEDLLKLTVDITKIIEDVENRILRAARERLLGIVERDLAATEACPLTGAQAQARKALSQVPAFVDAALTAAPDCFGFVYPAGEPFSYRTIENDLAVANVLDRLTDEQLNRLVYDKVEPDLLWIRMNGSIVGSVIGIFLFGLLRIAG